MDIAKLTERKRVAYRTSRGATGIGTVTQVYKDKGNKHRVVLHDKANNKDVTVWPSQCCPVPRG